MWKKRSSKGKEKQGSVFFKLISQKWTILKFGLSFLFKWLPLSRKRITKPQAEIREACGFFVFFLVSGSKKVIQQYSKFNSTLLIAWTITALSYHLTSSTLATATDETVTLSRSLNNEILISRFSTASHGNHGFIISILKPRVQFTAWFHL